MMRVALCCVLLAVLRPLDATACSCFAGEGADRVSSAPVMFQGRVTRITLSWGPMTWVGDEEYYSERLEVEFDVSRVWRGDVAATTVLITGLGGGDCGFEFRVGGEYVVPAALVGKRLATGLCDGVEPLWKAHRSLAASDDWHLPRPVVASISRSLVLSAYSAVAVAVTVILIGFLFVGRRREAARQS